MGNRASHLQQLALVALEVTSLTVYGIVLAGAVTDNAEERATLLERLERQQFILNKYTEHKDNVWCALFAALLDLIAPVFRNKRGTAPSTETICSLLGHAPDNANMADLDVASQILQVVWQMMRLSSTTQSMDTVECLAKQNAMVNSVAVIHQKLVAVIETLEPEEYRALRRLFFRVFGVYYDPVTSKRCAAADTEHRGGSTHSKTAPKGSSKTQYGTATMPRVRKRGGVSFISIPGLYRGQF